MLDQGVNLNDLSGETHPSFADKLIRVVLQRSGHLAELLPVGRAVVLLLHRVLAALPPPHRVVGQLECRPEPPVGAWKHSETPTPGIHIIEIGKRAQVERVRVHMQQVDAEPLGPALFSTRDYNPPQRSVRNVLEIDSPGRCSVAGTSAHGSR